MPGNYPQVADGKIGDVARIPLVFVPGLLCDHRFWRHQAEHLADLVDPIIVDVTEDGSMPEMALAVLNTAPERFGWPACPWAATWRWRSCGWHRSG